MQHFFVNSIRFWSGIRLDSWFLRLLVALLAILLAAPLFAILYISLFGEGQAFLSNRALLTYLYETFLYVGGVVLLSLVIALPSAWLTVNFQFRFRRLAVWLLMLPFAIPPYILAYSYDDLLRQQELYLFGLPIAIVVTALALYPYIFILMRMALRQQHCHIQSAARLLGCSFLSAFWRVNLPMARPAIGMGMALVIMEALNDIAVAEHFGVYTLGSGIYDLWLNRGDIINAARLSCLLMMIVLLLMVIEGHARRRQKQYIDSCDRCYECERGTKVEGWRAGVIWGFLFIPSLFGFLIPLFYLLTLSIQTPSSLWLQALINGLSGSVQISFWLMLILLCLGCIFALEKRVNRCGHWFSRFRRLPYLTYAMPGTILAQGFFLLALWWLSQTGFSLLTVGGIGLLLVACCSRFFIIAAETINGGMEKISPQLDSAAKMAAMRPFAIFWRVHIPLLHTAIATMIVIVLLEGLKELPMTLIFRPLNFDTLATVVYQYASDEALALAAPSALLLSLLAAFAVSVLFLIEGRDTRGQ